MERNTYFIAEATDDRFMGLIGVAEIPSIIGPVAYVSTMYVTPVERAGSYIFKKLLGAAEEWARERGLRVGLAATRYRQSTKFAERVGWSPVGFQFAKEL